MFIQYQLAQSKFFVSVVSSVNCLFVSEKGETLLDRQKRVPTIVATRPPIINEPTQETGGLFARWMKGRRGSGAEHDQLVKKNGQPPNLIKTTGSVASLKKCETVLALTGILRWALTGINDVLYR